MDVELCSGVAKNQALCKAGKAMDDSALVAEQIASMRRQEESVYYRSRDYLADVNDVRYRNFNRESQGLEPVDEVCRRKMCLWSCQVIDFFKFPTRETVFLASMYLDRFLSSQTEAAVRALANRKEFQLFSMTALYVAIKVHETLEVDVVVMSKLSRGDYSTEDFLRAELELLRVLEWRLNGPTSTDFVHRLFSLLPACTTKDTDLYIDDCLKGDSSDSKVCSPGAAFGMPPRGGTMWKEDYTSVLKDFARLQTELSVVDYTFVAARPSIIATAAVLNAVEAVPEVPVRREFEHAIKDIAGIDPFSSEVQGIKEQLRDCLSKTEGFERYRYAAESSLTSTGEALDDGSNDSGRLTPSMEDGEEGRGREASGNFSSHPSPVCVTRTRS